MAQPHCPACGNWMEVYESRNRTITYECCGIKETRALSDFDADSMRYMR